jgi:hypothetical protein
VSSKGAINLGNVISCVQKLKFCGTHSYFTGQRRLTEDRKTRATFPNYLWSKHSITRALEAAGFAPETITFHPLAADGAPETGSYDDLVGVFTARLA